MRIPVTDLFKYQSIIRKLTDDDILSENFTMEHLKLNKVPISNGILQKMRIYGLIDKVGRHKQVTTYQLSQKFSKKHNRRVNLFK